MAWEIVIWCYLIGIALVLLRQIAFALFEMDEFDWNAIDRFEFFGFLGLTAVFWPLIALKRPKALFNPACLFETELNRAKEAKAWAEMEKNPPYCSAQVLLSHIPNSGSEALAVNFTFPSEEIEVVLIESGRFGRFEGRGHKALLRWVELAVHCDPTKKAVPPMLRGDFNIVADELIYRGIGECHCPECSRTYPNKLLVPSTGSTGFGWLQNRYSCPEGHLVMSYDFIKMFCGSHKFRSDAAKIKL